MLTVKYIRNINNAPVVTYFDEQGMRTGLIISREAIGSTRLGDMMEIDEEQVRSGTEYGIDLGMLIDGDVTIPSSTVQNIMRSHGLWTEEDFQTKRQEFHAASLSLASQIVKTIDSALNQLEGE